VSTAPIARSVLTTKVISHLVMTLAPAGIQVGRGMAPPEGGWTQGQPGEGTFVPYVTLKTGTATTPAGMSDPVGRSRNSWEVGYVLTSTGALESQADDVGDQVRAAITALQGPFSLRGVDWVLQQVRTPRLGATTRNDSTDPPFWDVSDDVSLQLSRERGS